MIHAIMQVWGPLLLAALAGGVAGWVWHAGRIRPKHRALEAERRRLRAELLDLAVGLPPIASADSSAMDEGTRRRINELERALAEARGRAAEAEVLRHRIAELERNNGQARSVAAVDVTDYTKRIAALEGEIEAARRKVSEAEALQARVADLQPATPAAPTLAQFADSDLMKWRARYFEARTSFLEHAAKAAQADLDGAQGRVNALQTQLTAPPDDAEKTQLVWRNRYLTERLKYLETGAAPVPAPADEEEENRRRWRVRYLEKRVAYLEAADSAEAPMPVDVEPFKARIAELEAKAAEGEGHATKLVEAEDSVIRATWTSRYLQTRVKYLEERMTAALAGDAETAKRIADADAAREAALKQAADAEAARDAARKEAADALARAAAQPAPVVAPPPVTPAPQPLVSAPSPAAEPAVFRMERPVTMSSARNGAPDDLTLIEGIPAQTEVALHALGVHHFDQIAGWSAANVAWVNQYLNLGGRIGRERWVEQAQALAAG